LIQPIAKGPAGIAVINSIGNLAGFVLALAGLGIIAMGIVLMLGHDEASERARTAAAE
jgi:ACS family tartrate transporter-like MFS transporter